MRYYIFIAFLFLSWAAGAITPSATCVFADRDGQQLSLDIYYPSEDAPATLDGIAKPAILYVFGGGFITGRRDDPYIFPWLEQLTSDGYPVVCVDYRLGLKDKKLDFGLFHIAESARLVKRAVDMGIEDIFSAIRYLADNRDTLGIDTGNIVIAGSSAGAMISLSADLETCTPTERTALLPEGFSFKGVMSFAGAIISVSGLPAYQKDPAPHLLFHGDADEAVTYNKIAFGKLGYYGSSALVKEIFSKHGYVYNICRYPGHNHDIAACMAQTWPEQKRFLEANVIRGQRRISDSSIEDPDLPVWKSITLDFIYKQ